MTSTTDQPLLRISDPATLVVLVPYLLGFQPEASLVLVAIGANRRIALSARLDLPPGLPHTGLGALRAGSAHLGDAAARSGGQSVVAVVYPAQGESFDVGEWRAASATVIGGVTAAGLRPLDVLAVHDGRWWSLDCTSAACCPPEGTLLPPEGTAPAEAAARSAGMVVRGTRETIEALLDPAADERVAAVAEELERCRAGGRTSSAAGLAAVDLALRRPGPTSGAPSGPEPMTAEVAAALIEALDELRVRDAVLVLAPEDDGELPIRVWTEAVQLAPFERSAPVATLLAAAAYQRGDGALAGIALDHALTADPDYYLAALLLSTLNAGVPPSQLFADLGESIRAVRAEIEAEDQVAELS